MLNYSFSVPCLTLARYLFTENERVVFSGEVIGGGWCRRCFLLHQKGSVCLSAAGTHDS